MRLQKQLEQEFLVVYESELELEVELEQAAQKSCEIPILGHVQNLADKEGSDHPSCHSFGVFPAELRFSPALPHTWNFGSVQYS